MSAVVFPAFNSTLAIRALEVPPAEVPEQVRSIYAEQYCFLIVAVLLVYDSRESAPAPELRHVLNRNPQ